MSTDTTVSVRLTTDFDAELFLNRLGDVAFCGSGSEFTPVARTTTDVGDNTYVTSTNVTAGDYSIVVTSQAPFGNPSLSCLTPGNYTVALIDGPIPDVNVTSPGPIYQPTIPGYQPTSN